MGADGQRLYGLQQLRGVAALGVVVFHASELGGWPFLPGAFGVDLFFVISGFLMVAITGADTRPATFLLARIRRVAPLYWLATICLAAAMTLSGDAPTFDRLASALTFLPQDMKGPTAMGLPLLAPGWSLHYEMGFYALFAAALPLPLRWRTPLLSAALLSLVTIGTATARTAWTDPVLIEFAAGMWLGEMWKSRAIPRRVTIGTAACLASAAFVFPEFLDHIRLFAAALAVASVAAALRREPVRRRPRLEAIGDASYSIYLTHLLVMKPLFSLPVPPAALIVPAIVLGVAAGWLIHHRVERPLTRMLDPSRIRARSRAGTSRPSARAAP